MWGILRSFVGSVVLFIVAYYGMLCIMGAVTWISKVVSQLRD